MLSVTAFASMIRHLVFDVCDGDEAWLRYLRSMGFNDVDVSELYRLATAFLFSKETAESTAFQFVEQLHCFTWSIMEGLVGVLQTKRGSLAGMPLADVVYILALAKIIRIVRARCAGVAARPP